MSYLVLRDPAVQAPNSRRVHSPCQTYSCPYVMGGMGAHLIDYMGASEHEEVPDEPERKKSGMWGLVFLGAAFVAFTVLQGRDDGSYADPYAP
jgi:hypothetical protein